MQNRIIKFRAWDKIRRHMVSWEEITETEDDGFLHRALQSELFNGLVPMQFTGLLDKNGKEIYEGDVVQHAGHEIGAVEWQGQGWTIQPQMRDNPGGFFGGVWGQHIQVVGNIHENPDLIESAAKQI